MSKLEDKTVEIMDKAMIGAEKLTEKMAELAVQYGPDVVNAGLEVARFTAIGNLIGGLGWAVFTGVLVKTGLHWAKKAKQWNDEEGDNPVVFAYGMGAGCAVIGAIPAGLSALWPIFTVWNWVGIFEPKLWIAHRILEKAL
jgi:hypothetical protein